MIDRPAANPTAAALAWATAASYLATGALFFVDPTRNEEPGSVEYWELLAGRPVGRTAFVAALALTSFFALGVIGELRDRVLSGSVQQRGLVGLVPWATTLAYIGYATNLIGYVRLLGGEADRAEAFADGDNATRDAIQSFSLVLDTGGWLTFGAVGLFFIVINSAAIRNGSWPVRLAIVGIVSGVMSWIAMIGLLSDSPALLSVAAGFGGVVIAPIWWIWVGTVVRSTVRSPAQT